MFVVIQSDSLFLIRVLCHLCEADILDILPLHKQVVNLEEKENPGRCSRFVSCYHFISGGSITAGTAGAAEEGG